MKSYFTEDSIKKMLKLAGLSTLFLGLILFFQNILALQITGELLFIFGIGLIIASFDPEKHWLIILVSVLANILVSLFSIQLLKNGSISLNVFILFFVLTFTWIIPFIYSLNFVYESQLIEDNAPKKFTELIKMVRTNSGETLFELSQKENILLIFVRHFGCTFCRETVSEIAKLEDKIKGKNLKPVFVHMSDPSFGDEFFAKYYNHPVVHVSDPQRFLYKSLNIKRGTLNQLFGPIVLIKGLWAGIVKQHGIGSVESDALQLGGYFILSRGQIVFEHKAHDAADFFKIQILPEA